MNTTTTMRRTSPLRRIFGVLNEPQSYRNIGYLLLGLPLGTIWFAVLISGLSVAISTLVVALLGIPVMIGIWYLTRWFANAERDLASVLLDQDLPITPVAAPRTGNIWVRFRTMTSDRYRWRELAYLMLRFPVGIATFTAAAMAVAVPLLMAWAPFADQTDGKHPFGDWALSSRIEDVASTSWSFLLVPLGFAMLTGSFHLMNALAKACGRWTARWLEPERVSVTSGP
ncbi:MAG: hypothetical protein QOJ08_2060 [Ilumatobacteraceae bacterium]|jgi:hypothetical protein